MQEDFHYYATYCAAYLAGYSHKESLDISYSAQFVDLCSVTLLKSIDAPLSAATTQLQLEMMDEEGDRRSLQNITRIWASFHFLPKDLYAELDNWRTKRYKDKYRLICGPNGELVKETVELAKGGSLQAIGIAMHVLADTWAHRYFAGTPSLVINNTNYHFYEIVDGESGEEVRKVNFKHNPTSPDDLENGRYTNSLYQSDENSIMNLGHGRAGHFPDYSFAKYKYLPAWGEYREILKDNPSDYMMAFRQMIYALKYLKGTNSEFKLEEYDDTISPEMEKEIHDFLIIRRPTASDDWRALGERLSGESIPEFDLEKYQDEYKAADEENKNETFIGKFVLGALAQKSMVTAKIYQSGSKLAGISIDYKENGFKGIKDFQLLLDEIGKNIESNIKKGKTKEKKASGND